MNASVRSQVLLGGGLITVLMLLRLAAVWGQWPYSPMGAVAIFAGLMLSNRRLAVAVPLGAMLISDLILEPHPLMGVVYLSFAVSVAIGAIVRERANLVTIALGTVIGAVQFFLITNFAVWAAGGTHGYERSFAGLLECYTAALPFLQKSLAGDLIFSSVFSLGWLAVPHAVPNRQPAVVPVTVEHS